MKDARFKTGLLKESHWEQPFLQLPIAVPPLWWHEETRVFEKDDDEFPRVIIIDIAGEEEV
jgi:hypothetical protein